jgi:cytochrome c oxidase cbb3-type subunit II
MKGFFPLLAGLFGTFALSWIGLTVIPNWQIGHLDPQSDEEGTDIYPQPQSGMVERGLRVYNANGCVYCHSQWIRADYAGSDIERDWGVRRSAPRDYIFDRPVLLGKMRTGQDLANDGLTAPAASPGAAPATSPSPAAAASPAASPATPSKAAASPAATAALPAAATPAASPPASLGTETQSGAPPIHSAAWHYRHLYSPRSLVVDSNMPAYRFLFNKRMITGQRSADALQLTGEDAPRPGWEIVPSYDAQCLVAYLMSLDQAHPLNETKSAFAKAKPAASPSPAPSTTAPAK